ncbi:MAG: helicase [Acidimicrobiales bacterium]
MVYGARRSERASAGIVTVLSLLAVGLVTLIVSLTAQAAVGAARAQGAADAAALGAVLAGEDEASALARANGARLVAYETRGSCVEVLVVIGRSQARARAAVLDATGGYAC